MSLGSVHWHEIHGQQSVGHTQMLRTVYCTYECVPAFMFIRTYARPHVFMRVCIYMYMQIRATHVYYGHIL